MTLPTSRKRDVGTPPGLALHRSRPTTLPRTRPATDELPEGPGEVLDGLPEVELLPLEMKLAPPLLRLPSRVVKGVSETASAARGCLLLRLLMIPLRTSSPLELQIFDRVTPRTPALLFCNVPLSSPIQGERSDLLHRGHRGPSLVAPSARLEAPPEPLAELVPSPLATPY